MERCFTKTLKSPSSIVASPSIILLIPLIEVLLLIETRIFFKVLIFSSAASPALIMDFIELII
ncbi:MAG: hypothetical protein L0956_09015 [Candidatus Mariimomonas ferrooxydans]